MKENVILITIDALRSDILHQMMEDGDLPNISRIASEGTDYLNCYSNGPATPYSFPSMFEKDFHPFSDYNNSLKNSIVEDFSKLGYQTIGVVAQNYYISSHFQYNRGFDHFRDYFESMSKGKEKTLHEKMRRYRIYRKLRGVTSFVEDYFHWYVSIQKQDAEAQITSSRSGEYATKELISRLYQKKDPFYAWIHYMDVHSPYCPPKEYLDHSPMKVVYYNYMISRIRRGRYNPNRSDYKILLELYKKELLYVDKCIRTLIRSLKRNRSYKKTTIIITSDHGEMIGEHDQLLHPVHLYNTLLHVPLIIKGKGFKKEHVDNDLCELRDIVETYRKIMDDDYDGFSLQNSKRRANRDYVCARSKHLGGLETSKEGVDFMGKLNDCKYNIYSIQTTRYKLIYNDETGKSELYDIIEDPLEKKDLIKKKKQVHETLKELMRIEKNKHLLKNAISRSSKKKGKKL